MTTIDVLSPVLVARHRSPARAAQRFTPGDGGRITLLDNGKPRAKDVLRTIGDRLARQWGAAGPRLLGKESTSVVLTDAQAADLARTTDVLVTALGDCGACSTVTLQDILVMERHGVPSVAVVSEPFQGLAAAVCARAGYPGQPFVVVRHPVAALSPTELAAVCDAAIPALVDVLSSP